MIWVSWRQHRGQAAACLALLVALAVYAIVVGTSMRTAFGSDGLAGACLARPRGTDCPGAVTAFMNEFGSAVNIAFWSVCLIVPGLIGVLVGGSLIARELEYGTWRLAWSQTVPRGRWLAVKLALVTGGLIVLGAAMTAVITWYRAPMDRLTGHLQHNAYDFEGLVLTAYILCAFGFAVLAGLLLRRGIPAMVAAFIPWLAIRLVVEFLFRPHFMTPLTAQGNCGPPHGCSGVGISSVPQATGHIGDWVLGMNNNGYSYQPADRFWPFQFIEAGIFVALTAAALGTTIWLLHRRAAWTALSSAAVGIAAAVQDHGVVRERAGPADRRPPVARVDRVGIRYPAQRGRTRQLSVRRGSHDFSIRHAMLSGLRTAYRCRHGPRRSAAAYGSVDDMTADSASRSVRLERIENSRYTAINERGGTITIGTGQGTDFTPVELLLTAIGGCTAVDVDILTSRRAEPDSFEIVVDAAKVRDAAGNHLTDLHVTFRVAFPAGERGDKARELLPDAVRRSHDRLCTVSRTVELGTPVATRVE